MTANEDMVVEQNNTTEPEIPSDMKDEIDEIIDNLPDKPAEEDFLAAFYQMHLKAVNNLTKDLGKNALKRIIINIMMGEFAPKMYKPRTETERAVAYHFNEGVDKRMMLRFEHEVMKAQEAISKEEEDLKKINAQTNELLTPEAKDLLASLEDEK